MIFYVWLLLLSIVFSSSIHVVACISTSIFLLLLLGNIPPIRIYHILLIHSSDHGHLHVSIFLATWLFEQCYEHECTSFCVDLWGYIPRSGPTKPHGNSIFNILRNCQTVFQGGCIIILQSNNIYKCSSFSASLPTFVIVCLSVWMWNGISWWFDVQFPSDEWYWTSFYVNGKNNLFCGMFIICQTH